MLGLHAFTLSSQSEVTMTLFEVGRLCLKIAGRDAGRKAVVVEVIDRTFVLVDGEVRRKKVNIKHLEPWAQILKLPSGASPEKVREEFVQQGWKVWGSKKKVEGKEIPEKVKEERLPEKRETGVVPKVPEVPGMMPEKQNEGDEAKAEEKKVKRGRKKKGEEESE